MPAGAATSANQVIEISHLTNIDNATASLDSKTVHVDTGAVVVASSALPTGAATSANQTSEITQLTAINASTASLDSKTVHVDTGNVTVVSSSLPTGAATAANQTTEIGHLSTIDSNIAARLSGALVPTAYDEIDLTYIVAGPGTGQIGTAVYKLATVTVKTLTLTYDGSDRLSSVVAS